MPGSSSRRIFLSYRREDTAADLAALLLRHLPELIPDAHVITDVPVEPGQDAAAAIRAVVGSCAVLVALIGRRWAAATDIARQRRLGDGVDAAELHDHLTGTMVATRHPVVTNALALHFVSLGRIGALFG